MANDSQPRGAIAFGVIAVVVAMTVGYLVKAPKRAGKLPPRKPILAPIGASESVSQDVAAILAEQKQLDESLWVDEVAAQRYEGPFVELWDRLRSAAAPWQVLADFEFEQIRWPKRTNAFARGFGLRGVKFARGDELRSREESCAWLQSLAAAGYRLEQSEWHHARFVPAGAEAAHSEFNVTWHVAGPDSRRLAAKARISVTWKGLEATNAPPRADIISVDSLTLTERRGQPAFAEVKLPLKQFKSVLPILAHDLDGDRYSEIVLPAHNVVLWNQGGFKFEVATLMEKFPSGLDASAMMSASGNTAAVIDEFTGDELPDLVVALAPHGLFLFAMQADRRFAAPVNLLAADAELAFPSVITTGDVNGDGRTDLWLGQYKDLRVTGELPDPVFDANSGYPAYLLLNEGNGRFSERTEAAGLGQRRHRWTYSGSFWDFDNDGDLDLLTVNDYSGVDAYANDGRGNFTTVTDRMVDERANFGMGLAVADFDRDDHLDFFVTGMSSTTARRLESLGLGRREFPEIQRLRAAMAYGNRVYLGNGKGAFRQPAFKDQLARTGWSWGVGVLDFGNDGWPDLYVANGHVSNRSCRDYCTQFWTHDIYQDTKKSAEVTKAVMGAVGANWMSRGASWNGFEKNVLLLNHQGQRFVSAAYPLGVAFEYDSRSVLVDDLDLDGAQDLLVSRNDSLPRPHASLHLYRNVWNQNGNYIGFCLHGGKGRSASGARITIETASGRQTSAILNGDSFYTQHANTRMFGLGTDQSVKVATIVWPDGSEQKLKQPAINQYHVVARGSSD